MGLTGDSFEEEKGRALSHTPRTTQKVACEPPFLNFDGPSNPIKRTDVTTLLLLLLLCYSRVPLHHPRSFVGKHNKTAHPVDEGPKTQRRAQNRPTFEKFDLIGRILLFCQHAQKRQRAAHNSGTKNQSKWGTGRGEYERCLCRPKMLFIFLVRHLKEMAYMARS